MTRDSFYIDFLGCEKRKLDSEKILNFMKVNGYSHITKKEKIEDADIIIFVSCAFNEKFSKLSKEKIKKIIFNKNDKSELIISGCLPKIEPGFLKSHGLNKYAGPRNLKKFDEIIDSEESIKDLPDPNKSYFDGRDYPVPDKDFRSNILKEYVSAKESYKIRVDWGCLSNCSYCAIKEATKSLKSKPLNEIKDEIEHAIDSGENSLFVTGGDVGAYGQDVNKNITHLIDLLTSYKDLKIYIQEFNAKWLVRYSEKIIDKEPVRVFSNEIVF